MDKYRSELQTTILENTPALMAFHGLDRIIQWANPAYCKAAGLSAEKIRGRLCHEIWGADAPCPGCPVATVIETGEPSEFEGLTDRAHQGPHARHGWLVKAAPVRDADGALIGVIETSLDISGHTTRIRSHEKTTAALMRLLEYATIHSSRELLREFLDEAEDLSDSRIGFYHFVEEDQTTLSLQMWSANTMKLCSAPGAGTHYAIDQAGVWVDCVREGVPVVHNDIASLPHRKGLPDGHVPVVRELVVPVLRGGKLLAILGVGNKETDYTEDDVAVVEQLAELAWESVVRKRAEEENEKLQQQFIQAQKMESIGRLAGGVAHDFNNMLSVIIGHAEMAVADIDSTEPLYENLQEIWNAGRRSAHLTRQLLAFARQQTIAPRMLDLNETVGEILLMLRRLIGEDIDLVWSPSDDLGRIKMDPSQVDQTLANLCVNARDAISGVGRVTIETHNADFDEAYCTDHPEFSPGAYVMLAVSDDGCGMDQAQVTRIFEPFFTTKKAGEGTGLGLATVYGIVKQNSGFINVYSEPERGTTFRIYFARHDAPVPVTRSRREGAAPHGSGETILLIEDEKMILNLARRMIQELGYRVLATGVPEEALRIAREEGDAIDLLISDVIMPQMNGRELAEKLQEILPGLKVLFTSAYTTNVIAHHGILEEGISFLQKPYARKDLALKIREVMQQPGLINR